ncbi:MAG: hypothetical protein HPY60_01975 [Candidatus Methanofastidiosum sp.]|nr:hypothetical protein [Methanofastidiosum sp.]NYT04434.1 hypothetical protein [Candidatus Methanofastidiosa archaeon]
MFKKISRKNAIHVMLFYTGGCNGCDIEVANAAWSPRYDLEQYKVILTWNPREADVLAVTGPVLRRTIEPLKKIYEAIPEPKIVAAVGSCGVRCGIFKDFGGELGDSDEVVCRVDEVIPVDAYIPGCPARPEDIIAGIAAGIPLLLER